jgi:hypothetical protein
MADRDTRTFLSEWFDRLEKSDGANRSSWIPSRTTSYGPHQLLASLRHLSVQAGIQRQGL